MTSMKGLCLNNTFNPLITFISILIKMFCKVYGRKVWTSILIIYSYIDAAMRHRHSPAHHGSGLRIPASGNEL